MNVQIYAFRQHRPGDPGSPFSVHRIGDEFTTPATTVFGVAEICRLLAPGEMDNQLITDWLPPGINPSHAQILLPDEATRLHQICAHFKAFAPKHPPQAEA